MKNPLLSYLILYKNSIKNNKEHFQNLCYNTFLGKFAL